MMLEDLSARVLVEWGRLLSRFILLNRLFGFMSAIMFSRLLVDWLVMVMWFVRIM